MFHILTLNSISKRGLAELPAAAFTVADDVRDPDAILVRSASMLNAPLSPGLWAIARAGAGHNNIPVSRCSEEGVVVFNTPGANANAVMELTLAGLLLSSRKIVEGIGWVSGLKGVPDLAERVEKGKMSFAGPELEGKKLGVVGLGAVGVLVANACEALGMAVSGYDPHMSLDAAWGLSRNVGRAVSLDVLLEESDYVTLHMPLIEETWGVFGAKLLSQMKPGARLLNFSRGEIVSDAAVLAALESGCLSRYVTDFPSNELLGAEKVLAIPHLGASTPEAEDNCAVMAALQLKNFLQHGSVKNSVNLPDCDSGPALKPRITVIIQNVPNVVGPVTTALADANINISNMLNKSKGDYSYNIIDLDSPCPAATLEKITRIKGVVRARRINGK
ncbi:MAG: phosphoglycerate dehydrogenase [Synergistaceae bacterium]|jgi:D-3-phosphoglycerate dehydrogenase|nr:phosphoglycerate dehydrogenase [Synergistaceae bacterium]